MRVALLITAVMTIAFFMMPGCGRRSVPKPPAAAVKNVVDEFFGVKVDDPYRYMENLEDGEVQDWIKAQAEYTEKVLGKIPGRDKLLQRLKELDGGKPFRTSRIRKLENGTMFYQKRNADENIPKLYVRVAGSADEKLLVDPESIESEDNQHYSIDTYSPSADGRYVVYGLAQGGSEETVYHILDIESGEHLPETIDRIETAYNRPHWLDDGSGFFYSRRRKLPPDTPETEIYKKTVAFYHKLGTDPQNDIAIMGIGLSKRVPLGEVDFPSMYMPPNSDFAIAKVKHGDSNELTIYTAPKKTLLGKNIPWKKVCDVEDEVTNYAVFGGEIYLQSADNAPRFKVVKTSLRRPSFRRAKVVIKPGDQVVDNILAAGDALYAGVLDGGFNRIVRVAYDDGVPKMMDLPDGAAGYIVAVNQVVDGVMIYTNSWDKGSLIYEYDPVKRSFTDTKLMPKGEFDDLPGFTSKEVKVKSHDGVMVPLSIIHKSDIVLDGSNPTRMMAYGSYGISIGVFFSPLNIAWLERGGVIAIAHVRGGGEYGKAWHLAGQKLNKPNTWKDFIACGEYLIDEGYTSSNRLAGQGGSAGGITIGRAITERPDLFAAALINVGALDAIRFETTTNGVPNIPEFGTVAEKDGFHGLLEMSSYHQVKDGVEYPAVMLLHGINDPRVEPWMSAKMTARLQAATAGDKPVLFRVEYSGGHGIGSTRDQYLAETADEWAFLLGQFGVKI